MGITFTEGSGLNDSVFGKSQGAIRLFLEKRGEAFEQQSVIKELFQMGQSNHYLEKLTSLTGMDMVTASATAKPVNLASNISSLITRIASGQVVFGLALPAMLFSISGPWIGSRLALTRGAKFIRYVMLGVLALLVVTLIIEMI